ncbi:hypothetical protein SASPL_110438 [Salvia splendens]|uniref:Purple acid phosphatase N-terminal domain-containing protein n=1 Tax=Salvia splendens TaxID=180675 RepID=A0A8X8Y5F6_SALSN|nr:hypothetical protein SASPL_110438 [Salvia splendens]
MNTLHTVALLSILVAPSSSKVSISVAPRSVSKSSDPVTIKWSGLDSPSHLDWLGIYTPVNSGHRHFIGYIFLSSSPGWQSGSGSITIPLVNMRSDYQFRIFHPDKTDHDHNLLPRTTHLLAKSDPVTFEPGRGPEQVHLALTGGDREMRVMFVTHDGNESFVKYGLTQNGLDRVAGTEVAQYEREDMCDSPANDSAGWRDPGFIHDGVMLGLKDGKKYYYRWVVILGGGGGGWSTIYNFVSPVKDSSETIAFLFGDMGTATPDSMHKRISYARGYSWLWDNFFYQIEPVASKVPYMVCIGNHEYDWLLQPWKPDWSNAVYGKDGGGECGVPYSLSAVVKTALYRPDASRPLCQSVYGGSGSGRGGGGCAMATRRSDASILASSLANDARTCSNASAGVSNAKVAEECDSTPTLTLAEVVYDRLCAAPPTIRGVTPTAVSPPRADPCRRASPGAEFLSVVEIIPCSRSSPSKTIADCPVSVPLRRLRVRWKKFAPRPDEPLLRLNATVVAADMTALFLPESPLPRCQSSYGGSGSGLGGGCAMLCRRSVVSKCASMRATDANTCSNASAEESNDPLDAGNCSRNACPSIAHDKN